MVAPIPRRWFPQKILPLTYDDSLSYYEFLCKILAKINELIEDTTNKEMYDNLKKNIAEEYDDKKAYVKNNYVWYNETLYRCESATTGDFDDTKWTECTVADYLQYIIGLILQTKNEDFWKVMKLFIREYSNGYYMKDEWAFEKINNTSMKLGKCLVSGQSDAFEQGYMWDIEIVTLDNLDFISGAIDNGYNMRITENKEHIGKNFQKICSIINSIAVEYNEAHSAGIPTQFKKYDLCWIRPTNWYNEDTFGARLPLYFAKANTNSSLEFSTDNWQEIAPFDPIGNQYSFADYIKAMIDEYGGGEQPIVIRQRQNLRNEVNSNAE